MYAISKEFKFSAAHMLPGHTGKCQYLHGHNYKLQVDVRALGLIMGGTSDGMVMDFADLKKLVDPIVARMDHTFLAKGDEWPCAPAPFTYTAPGGPPVQADICMMGVRTTAENLARVIWSQICAALDDSRYQVTVRLWETDSSCAWYPEAD